MPGPVTEPSPMARAEDEGGRGDEAPALAEGASEQAGAVG
jgi:hypothetical protein